MKTITYYALWLIITSVYSAYMDSTKEEVLFRFVFTFIFFTIVLILVRYGLDVLQHTK